MKASMAQVDLFAPAELAQEETPEEREQRYWELRGRAAEIWLGLGECRTDDGRERRLAKMRELDGQADAIELAGRPPSATAHP
jgi:hypothetical protein